MEKNSSLVFTAFEDFSVILAFPFKFHDPYRFILFLMFRYVFLAVAGHYVKCGFLDDYILSLPQSRTLYHPLSLDCVLFIQ